MVFLIHTTHTHTRARAYTTHTHTHTASWMHMFKVIQKQEGRVLWQLFIHLLFSLLRQSCYRSLERVFSLGMKGPGFSCLGFKGDYIQGCSITLNRCDIPGWGVGTAVDSWEWTFQNHLQTSSARGSGTLQKAKAECKAGWKPFRTGSWQPKTCQMLETQLPGTPCSPASLQRPVSSWEQEHCFPFLTGHLEGQ